MKLAKYLGLKASCFIEAEPFKGWPVERSVDDDSDPPDLAYIFVGCGLEFRCDRSDERIRCIFIMAETHDGTVLSEMPFHLRRDEVLANFGIPEFRREGFSDPILGDYGPADRFHGSEFTIHVEYKVDSDSIKMITLMRNDAVPR